MNKQRMKWQVWLVVAIAIMLFYKAFSSLDLSLKLADQNKTSTTISTNEYQKRQFDTTENMFQTKLYPKELTDFDQDNLVSMKCSPTFFWDYKASYVYHSKTTKEKVVLTDPRLLALAKKAREYIGEKFFDEITFCETKDGRTIVEYEKQAGGGGMETVAYIAIADTENNFEQIISIPNPKLPYFVCRYPLQLTTDNILYYGCGAGDAGFGAFSIYKIDLVSKTSSLIIQCYSYADFDNKNGGKVVCE